MKVGQFDKKLRRYKSNYLRQVTRINNNEMPKIILNYTTNERSRFGGPLKRLLDDAETGLSGLPRDG
jgi:hypothetical protein